MGGRHVPGDKKVPGAMQQPVAIQQPALMEMGCRAWDRSQDMEVWLGRTGTCGTEAQRAHDSI